MTARSHLLLPLVAGLLAALAGAPAARADDIVHRDPDTCTETIERGVEITSETWTEIRYKEGGRGAEKLVPTALLIDIVRSDKTPQVRDLLNAIGEFQRGNLSEAVPQLRVLSGGGYVQDLETRRRVFKSFAENDPSGKGKRPPWPSEYAHFYFAKALYEAGVKRDDQDLLNEALLTLEDVAIPDGEGKTGGFLGRFEGGNSRWYAEAMLLRAKTLVALGRTKDALTAYKALDDKAAALDIGPQWAFEAKLGPAVVAEAEGKYNDAISAANDAATTMRLMLRDETRNCLRRALGRFFSRARMQAASVRLQQAEKNRSPAEFRKLRDFIEESTPQALRKAWATLPAEQREALVAGAMDPHVQAVLQNARGIAALQEKKFDEAILAFRAVEVKYFAEPDQHARALHYLSQAADAAAKKASRAGARTLYESYRDGALERLRQEHPQSPWAQPK